MKNRLPFFVYLAGMFPLGYWQDSLRSLLGDWLALLSVIAYLLMLRLIGALLVRLVDFRHRLAVAEHNRLVEERRNQKCRMKKT